MKIIHITRPDFWKGEVKAIRQQMEEGLEILHLRKPESTLEAYESLLEEIDRKYLNRIVLHEHFKLAEKYQVRGIHLNRRNPNIPANYHGQISRSCHSLEEVIAHKPHSSYVFLSPIFDSISKKGYSTTFRLDELCQAAKQGIIDEKVIALGGVTPERLPLLEQIGFGGAALLGAAWPPHF